MAGAMDKLDEALTKLDNLPDRLKQVLDSGNHVNTPSGLPSVVRGQESSLANSPPLPGGVAAAKTERQQQPFGGPQLPPTTGGTFSSQPALPSVVQPRYSSLGSSAAPVPGWLGNRATLGSPAPATDTGRGLAGRAGDGANGTNGLLRDILAELRKGKGTQGNVERSNISGPERKSIRVGVRR
jgi:hypothetical protein